MKKVLGIFTVLVFLFVSCDIIEGPYLEPNNETKTDVEFPELNKDSVIRKILFEEFTGHYCTNCPEKGHRVLEGLIAQYGDLLVPVTIALWTVLLVKSIPMNQAISIPYRKENEQSCNPSAAGSQCSPLRL